MTANPFDAARAALDDLLLLAGAPADDDTTDAARDVLAVLDAGGVRGERCSPGGCPLRLWLARQSGVAFHAFRDQGFPRLWLAGNVLIVIAGPGAEGRRCVPLPEPVAGAVRLIDAHKAPRLAGEGEDFGRRVA